MSSSSWLCVLSTLSKPCPTTPIRAQFGKINIGWCKGKQPFHARNILFFDPPLKKLGFPKKNITIYQHTVSAANNIINKIPILQAHIAFRSRVSGRDYVIFKAFLTDFYSHCRPVNYLFLCPAMDIYYRYPLTRIILFPLGTDRFLSIRMTTTVNRWSVMKCSCGNAAGLYYLIIRVLFLLLWHHHLLFIAIYLHVSHDRAQDFRFFTDSIKAVMFSWCCV